MIVQVVATILAMDHTQICAGEEHCALGGGVMAFLFWSRKDSKKGEKRHEKL